MLGCLQRDDGGYVVGLEARVLLEAPLFVTAHALVSVMVLGHNVGTPGIQIVDPCNAIVMVELAVRPLVMMQIGVHHRRHPGEVWIRPLPLVLLVPLRLELLHHGERLLLRLRNQLPLTQAFEAHLPEVVHGKSGRTGLGLVEVLVFISKPSNIVPIVLLFHFELLGSVLRILQLGDHLRLRLRPKIILRPQHPVLLSTHDLRLQSVLHPGNGSALLSGLGQVFQGTAFVAGCFLEITTESWMNRRLLGTLSDHRTLLRRVVVSLVMTMKQLLLILAA
mmetsp:Transcript_7341/g.11503  ORF Transcript_7341/g.11503 Transcript_7341/m.11503 type:complete len:278 (-) Transcript_7341:3018-3851(-)